MKSPDTIDRAPLPPHCREAVAARMLPPVETLIDVGCGVGRFLAEARGKYRTGMGVDADPQSLRSARGKGAFVAQAEIEEAELPCREMTAAACLDVIEHVRDPGRLLGKIGRVLRPGGLLLVSTPNIRYWTRLAARLFRGSFPRTSSRPGTENDGGHLHYFTVGDMVALLSGNGFAPLRVEGVYSRRGPLAFFVRRFPGISALRPAVEFLSPGMVILAEKTSRRG